MSNSHTKIPGETENELLWWRQSLCDGDWLGSKSISVSPEYRERLQENFILMREAGCEIRVFSDHDTKRTPIGTVRDVRQNGHWLEELHQYISKPVRDFALKRKISLGIGNVKNPDTGEKLGRAIEKVFWADKALRDARPDDRVVLEELVFSLTA